MGSSNPEIDSPVCSSKLDSLSWPELRLALSARDGPMSFDGASVARESDRGQNVFVDRDNASVSESRHNIFHDSNFHICRVKQLSKLIHGDPAARMVSHLS